MLNSALKDDTLTEGYILKISIYIEWGAQHDIPFGKRAKVYQGSAPMETILEQEVEGRFIERVEGESEVQGSTIVLVSAFERTRDRLRNLAKAYPGDRVTMKELDFQPSKGRQEVCTPATLDSAVPREIINLTRTAYSA
ncbi:putative cell surface metalloreductase [Phaeomoniella chlamydospora]|uniref:Putative cell surface metalloreductase n=1 Tax=Phaeomoniella chlamydospora TaxID=158046 RepID=A0A0G2F345_PHACM|nr:putative cell surface metalloreductase [Phaeomoniella chlamydospora]